MNTCNLFRSEEHLGIRSRRAALSVVKSDTPSLRKHLLAEKDPANNYIVLTGLRDCMYMLLCGVSVQRCIADTSIHIYDGVF